MNKMQLLGYQGIAFSILGEMLYPSASSTIDAVFQPTPTPYPVTDKTRRHALYCAGVRAFRCSEPMQATKPKAWQRGWLDAQMKANTP